MASTLENRLFNNMRELPLPALNTPSPSRIHPMDHGLVRDGWVHGNNIWQTSPRAFDFAARDHKTNVLPNKISKLSVADTSKIVAAASTNDDHNIGASASEAIHEVSMSTYLTNPTRCQLASPQRLRSNGGLDADTRTAMTSTGHLSLLSGSALEVYPLKASSSSPYSNRKGSTIGRSFRQFNVEDAEEFVPSHLQSQRQPAHHTHNFESNNLLTDHNVSVGSDTNVYKDRYRPSSSKHTQYYAGEQPQTTIINGARGGNANINHVGDRDVYTAASHDIDSPSTPFHAAQPYAPWVRRQARNNVNHDSTPAAVSNPSNLRPDVASYQPPSASTINHIKYINQQDAGRHPYGASNALPVTGANGYNQLTGRPLMFTNSHAFSVNSSHGASAVLHHNEYRQHQEPAQSGSEFNSTTIRHSYPVDDHKYHNYSRTISSIPNSRLTSENGTIPYITPPQKPLYNNTPYRYSTDPLRGAAPRQTPYIDPSSGMFDCFPDSSYQQEHETTESPRSEFLEEFRLYHKVRKYELKDIYGYVVEFSGDQAGSRFIQNKLEQANSDEKEMIFSELQTDARQLMSDVFGNYVIQKMFDHGNQSQKKALASQLHGNVLRLSLHPYGCRSVQRALEHVLTDQQASLIKELDGHVMTVVESQHGNHVIQKAIECIPGEHIQFIVDAHKNQVVRLSKHTYGCRIIQRMLEHCSPSARRSILDELHHAIPSLIDDQFGNYVIQCIIKRGDEIDRYRVIGFVQQRLLDYSIHKFASNVVEKAIVFAGEGQRAEMVRLLTEPHPYYGGQSPVFSLLQDQFGNYVLQTVLRTIDPPSKLVLADTIRRHLNYVPKATRGKQIAAMMDTVNATLAGHSPSSISTGPQTPRTPTSFHPSSGAETPMTKAMEEVPSDFSHRETQHNIPPSSRCTADMLY